MWRHSELSRMRKKKITISEEENRKAPVRFLTCMPRMLRKKFALAARSPIFNTKCNARADNIFGSDAKRKNRYEKLQEKTRINKSAPFGVHSVNDKHKNWRLLIIHGEAIESSTSAAWVWRSRWRIHNGQPDHEASSRQCCQFISRKLNSDFRYTAFTLSHNCSEFFAYLFFYSRQLSANW